MGFEVVIAPSFADIFTVNSLQNGLLPVQLPTPIVARLRDRAAARDGYQLAVHLRKLQIRDHGGPIAEFAVDSFWRDCLLSGRDPIAMALAEAAAIDSFERARPGWRPLTNAEGL